MKHIYANSVMSALSKNISRPEVGAVYKHYKGNKYLVLAIGKHSETTEDMVIYVSLYDNPESQVWVRPLGMFMETIEFQGKALPRFTKLANN